MEIINYAEIESQSLPADILSFLTQELGRENVQEITQHCQVRIVNTPFILADNEFDLDDCNNNLFEVNVDRVHVAGFTGGAICLVYEKTGPNAYVIQGNDEEGYNIFKLV